MNLVTRWITDRTWNLLGQSSASDATIMQYHVSVHCITMCMLWTYNMLGDRFLSVHDDPGRENCFVRAHFAKPTPRTNSILSRHTLPNSYLEFYQTISVTRPIRYLYPYLPYSYPYYIISTPIITFPNPNSTPTPILTLTYPTLLNVPTLLISNPFLF